jgi:hypothetical protein
MPKDNSEHAHARGIKTWLNWLVNEDEPVASPMRKVYAPSGA